MLFCRLGYDNVYRWTGSENWTSNDASPLMEVTAVLHEWWQKRNP